MADRRAQDPQTNIPSEQSWPTQPFPTLPPPFGRQKFTVDDVNPWLLTKEHTPTGSRACRKCATRDSTLRLRRSDRVDAGNQGGSNWGTTAADPDKGMVFVLNIDAVAILKLDNTVTKVGGFQMGGGGRGPQSGQVIVPAVLFGLPRREHAESNSRCAESRRRDGSTERGRDRRNRHGRERSDAARARADERAAHGDSGHLGYPSAVQARSPAAAEARRPRFLQVPSLRPAA